MAFESDTIIDRRRLKRRLNFWRLAVLILVLGVGFFTVREMNGFPGQQDYIARYHVFDVIVDDPWRDDLLREVADDDQIRALVVRMDSPGGTTAGSEALYESLLTVAQSKPVVVVMGTVAASGGYMASLAADRIFARNNTITGSIGVIYQAPNAKKLLDEWGIEFNTVKTSDLKAAPDFVSETSPEALAAVREMINDTQDWFVDLVQDRRKMTDAEVATVSDGRVFTGRRALELKLVDEIGGEPEALVWLESARNVSAGLPVVDVFLYEEDDLLIEILREASLGVLVGEDLAAELGNLYQTLKKTVGSQRLTLDGLVSVWNP